MSCMGGVCHQLNVVTVIVTQNLYRIISLLAMFSLPHCESPSQTVVVPLQKLAASGSTNPLPSDIDGKELIH